MSWIARPADELADFARDLTEALDRLGEPHPDCPIPGEHDAHPGQRYRDDGEGLVAAEQISCPGRH